VNIKSDYYNPLTNQQNNKNTKKRDDTLEHIAIPLFSSIKIERKEELKLAVSIYKKIIELTNLAAD
jgi:hypothetical protein